MEPLGLLVAATALTLATPFTASAADSERDRPNILLVLLDDVGFMDFGAYGSDTATPKVDELGASGAMFTRYYTHPQCGTSRASLMTEQDDHVVGAGSLTETLSEEMRALPADRGVLLVPRHRRQDDRLRRRGRARQAALRLPVFSGNSHAGPGPARAHRAAHVGLRIVKEL